MNLTNEVDKPMVKKTIVVYAGRFQPFHKGHYASYYKLVSKFGADNVYIGTSNDTSGEKSPFNFKEKKEIATKMFGIPSSKFVQIKNPYKPVEILKKFDGETTQYIAAVGEKDSERLLHGSYFKPYKDKAGYGYEQIGYVYPVPAEKNPISGTDVRNGLGTDDKEAAKKFFLKAYPKFDKDIFKLITSKLIKEDFPGGVGVGLNLPNGYINGAPKKKDVDKLSSKLHTTSTETDKKYVYDPISEIIERFISEEMFNTFVQNYLGEAPNAALDRDITYKNTKGQQKKIKARDALRLPKDHPAHIQASKLVGADKTAGMAKGTSNTPANEPKKQPTAPTPVQAPGTVAKKGDGKPATASPLDKNKGAEKPAAPPPPPEQKLSGDDLKSNAEKSKSDKVKSWLKKSASQALQKTKDIIKDFSEEEQHDVHHSANPHSEMRKSWTERGKQFIKELPKNIAKAAYGVAKHKYHQFKNTGKGLQSLAVSVSKGEKPKFGYFKNKEGKWQHSEHEAKKQKKACIATVVDAAVITASIATGGAISGAANHIMSGGGVQGLGHAALHGAGHSFHAVGTFAHHAAVDFAKHCGFESVGLAAGASHTGAYVGAAGAGLGHVAAQSFDVGSTLGKIATQAVGLTEGKDDVKAHADMFIKLIADMVKRMETFKPTEQQLLASVESYKKRKEQSSLQNLTKGLDEKVSNVDDEHYVPSTGMFNRKLSVQQKIDKLNPARAIEKSKIWHNTFAHHNPETGELKDDDVKESISESKIKSIQHFVEWATKRLKLSETPKVVLISGKEYSQQQSSLGGYSPQTKEIYVVTDGRLGADIIRTIAHEMVHRKQDEMGLIKDSVKDGADGSKIENKANAVAGILLREYGRINKKIYVEQRQYINEVSNMGVSADDQANGAWLPKGAVRKLGGNDGANTSDNWYENGGYTQTDFPKADAIYGDEDANVFAVKYTSQNMPTYDDKITEFPDAEIPKPVLNEMGSRDIHLKNIINKYKDKTFRKRINAYLFGNPNYNNHNEVARTLRNMGYEDVTKMEKDLNLHNPDLDETIKKVGDKYVVYPKNGGDRLGTHDSMASAKKQLAAIEINKEAINKKNVNNINLVLNTVSLKRFQSTPTFTNLLNRSQLNNLKIGDNKLVVNNTVLGTLERLQSPGNYKVERLKEDISINVNPGDEVLMGKFKNKKIAVKNIGKDQHGMPTINGKQATTFRTINEELLMEGGAYGHMSHPFDDMNLTFGQLKDIISKALDGELGVVREKTDGQALAISWKNGRLIAARNKGHLANSGANAMGIEDVASKFAGRGGLTDAYNFAMKDLSAAISGLSQKQREKIFNEGKCFMNIEVIWPESVNVIPYGQALLIFHNTTCYNDSGEAIAADQSTARTLAGMIKQINLDVQSKYTIQGPPITEIPKNQNLSSKKGGWITKLTKIQNEFDCDDSDTMAVYHQHWWSNFIDKNSPEKVDNITKEALIRRWAFGDKSFRINTISNQSVQDWAMETDKVDVLKRQKENMKKFEEIFLGVGADVLEFVSSVLTVHPDKAIRSMKDRLKQVASQVKASTDATKILKFKNELERLNSLGGIDRIVASEGLVFFYNGKTYKLTGTFAPLNQLLGIFYE